MRKLTCPPSVEILGVIMIALIQNLQGHEVEPIMEKYGIQNPSPDKWYREQPLLDALNELSQRPNRMFNFVAIGMEIGRIYPISPDLKNPDIGQVLMGWNDMYQSIHRNGDVGAIACEKVSDKHYRLIMTDIYPDDFSYGIISGYAKRFLPSGTAFNVFYDPDTKSRDYGGDGPTVIHLIWE